MGENTTHFVNENLNTGKALMRMGVFKSKPEMVCYVLMRCIREMSGPVGSWALKANMENFQLDFSTATIGRHLKTLDDKEYTVQRGNQGRILTPLGMSRLEEFESNLERAYFQKQLTNAMRVNKYEELSDLISVRKALETEAAWLACKNATEEDLKRLDEAVERHRNYVEDNLDPTEPALNFHELVAEISHNKFMAAMLNLLMYEERRIESLIDTLVTRERGRVYIEEHVSIAQAIRERNAELAAKRMETHIAELHQAISEQAHEFTESAVGILKPF